MPKTTIVRARVDPRRKAAAEAILKKLGVTPTQAVNMLYAQVIVRRAIPFAVSVSEPSESPPVPNPSSNAWDGLDNKAFSHLI